MTRGVGMRTGGTWCGRTRVLPTRRDDRVRSQRRFKWVRLVSNAVS